LAASTLRSMTAAHARRLAITKQHLHEEAEQPQMLDVVRDLGCLQLDPTNAVAKSHLLVLWSRLGAYDQAALDSLLWEDRSLFEYWAHAASIVLTEDYPIHKYWMRVYGTNEGAWGQRMAEWSETNAQLHDHILDEIRQQGALPSKVFEDKSEAAWQSSGWTGNRNVSQMLGYLWEKGQIMVASRKGGHRYWDLTERVLPTWTPLDDLSAYEFTYRAAQRAVRALGVATTRQVIQHFTRSRYHDLPKVMNDLVKDGLLEPVQITDGDSIWSDNWYIHQQDIPLLEQIQLGDWVGRTTLLSPFDNLICDRDRTKKMFGFDFKLEIYVPKAKREYGYYVLPILHEDKLIGRIDPLMNRKQGILEIQAVYAERDAPKSRKVAQAIAASIESLAGFLGAATINYTDKVPSIWQPVLKNS